MLTTSTAQLKQVERYNRVESRPAVSTFAGCREDLTSAEHLPEMHKLTREANHLYLLMPLVEG